MLTTKQIVEDEPINRIMQQFCFIMMAASVFSGVSLAISYVWLPLIEFVGPLFALTSWIMMLIVNLGIFNDTVDETMRLLQCYLFVATHFVHMMFTTVSYVPHVIFRQVANNTAFFCLQFYRHSKGELDPVWATIGVFTVTSLVTEMNTYLNFKTKAELFEKI